MPALARTSPRVTRPSGPEPVTSSSEMPWASATRRASGVARTCASVELATAVPVVAMPAGRCPPLALAAGGAGGSATSPPPSSVARLRPNSGVRSDVGYRAPTGSVVPSGAMIWRTPARLRRVRHSGLVGLDLEQVLSSLHLLAVGLEPGQDRALLHRVGQLGIVSSVMRSLPPVGRWRRRRSCPCRSRSDGRGLQRHRTGRNR